MSLTAEQQIEVLQGELANLEFGKRHYEKSPIYTNQIKHKIHMQNYSEAIIRKQKAIEKLKKQKDGRYDNNGE